METKLLTVAGVVATYGFRSKKSVCRMVERGELPFRKLGRGIYFLRADMDRYLAELPGVSPGQAIETLSARKQAA